jgi:CRISPR/Cas system CSM-associated protein Csm3 (group 7 of RAMP superfamily)
MSIIYCSITNHSPMLLSSGLGSGSTIDVDIITDDFGIPYFPARRLKGLLRESAMEVLEILKDAIFSKEEVNDLFGKQGGDDSNLIIHDFRIKEYEKNVEWIRYLLHHPESKFPISKETLINSFTTMIMRTTIDDDGIAKKNSLRKLRVLKKGFTFFGEIQINKKNGRSCYH